VLVVASVLVVTGVLVVASVLVVTGVLVVASVLVVTGVPGFHIGRGRRAGCLVRPCPCIPGLPVQVAQDLHCPVQGGFGGLVS
ncbi:hypothetical protein ABKW28_20535, partial [Nocardioides sp. 31GB23]|uniref:hypothetical protein n=1 Tax=Nocardioides sp. 31GB23 TaxID=3156065 RepID=UPI0032AF52AC